MIAALFVLVLLVGVGTSLTFLAQNELDMSRSGNDERQSFLLAEAGVEAARMHLRDINAYGDLDGELATAAGPDSTLSLSPNALRPVFNTAGTLVSFTGTGDDAPLRPQVLLSSAGAPGGDYAAYLTNDPVDGIANQTDTNRRVMITSIGVSKRRSSEVVQAIIETEFMLPPMPPAAMTMLGPSPSFDNGTSSAQDWNGADCPKNGGGVAGLFVPIVGVSSPAADAYVAGDMQQPSHFHSGALTGTDTIGDLTNPADPAMAQSALPPIDPVWTNCAQLAQLIRDLVARANYYCNSDTSSCAAPAGAPGDILVIDGDGTTGAFDSGLLVVTGELSYGGNDSWDGLVLVVGEGRLVRSGGGNGHSTGALVLANIDPSPNGPRADKSDWCASGFAQASVVIGGAGNSTISYWSAEITRNNPRKLHRSPAQAQTKRAEGAAGQAAVQSASAARAPAPLLLPKATVTACSSLSERRSRTTSWSPCGRSSCAFLIRGRATRPAPWRRARYRAMPRTSQHWTR